MHTTTMALDIISKYKTVYLLTLFQTIAVEWKYWYVIDVSA